MAVNIHITIIELNALHTKRQNLFQELDAVIHLLMEAKHWGLRKSRNATSLNSRFKSLDTLKVKIISVTFRRVIRTNHKKASKIWRHENIQLGGKECRSEERFSRNAETDLVCRLLLEKKKSSTRPVDVMSCKIVRQKFSTCAALGNARPLVMSSSFSSRSGACT